MANRTVHLGFSALQSLLLLLFLRTFSGFFEWWEKTIAYLLPGKPLPALSEVVQSIGQSLQSIEFEWPYLSLMIVGTYFFVGLMILFSAEDMPVALHRSYLFQVSSMLLIAFVIFVCFVAVLLPFVTTSSGRLEEAPEAMAMREKLWIGGTVLYFVCMGVLAFRWIGRNKR
ncbi:MAG: hypothetical protein AAF591_19205, partial [Verrucomicrobiota bacterium]